MIKTHEMEVRQAVQDFLTDEFNAYDGSVGIYPVGEVDQDLVLWINEDVEGFKVSEWDQYSLIIECEGVFVKVALKDGQWEIVDEEKKED